MVMARPPPSHVEAGSIALQRTSKNRHTTPSPASGSKRPKFVGQLPQRDLKRVRPMDDRGAPWPAGFAQGVRRTKVSSSGVFRSSGPLNQEDNQLAGVTPPPSALLLHQVALA